MEEGQESEICQQIMIFNLRTSSGWISEEEARLISEQARVTISRHFYAKLAHKLVI